MFFRNAGVRLLRQAFSRQRGVTTLLDSSRSSVLFLLAENECVQFHRLLASSDKIFFEGWVEGDRVSLPSYVQAPCVSLEGESSFKATQSVGMSLFFSSFALANSGLLAFYAAELSMIENLWGAGGSLVSVLLAKLNFNKFVQSEVERNELGEARINSMVGVIEKEIPASGDGFSARTVVLVDSEMVELVADKLNQGGKLSLFKPISDAERSDLNDSFANIDKTL